jgi:hypothetical protein
MFPNLEKSDFEVFDAIKDYSEKNRKETFFHYTTFKAFKNIIKSKSIHFSNQKHLIDKTEFLYGIDLIESILNEEKDSKKIYSDKQIFEINEMIEYTLGVTKNNSKYTGKEPIELFYFCLTEDEDSLSLWNLFKNEDDHPIAIKFEKDISEIYSHQPFYYKVIYSRAEQEEILKGPLKKYLNLYETSSLEKRIIHFSFQFAFPSIFFKDCKYKVENEWRFAQVNIPHHENYREIKFKTKEDNIVPYLEFELEELFVNKKHHSIKEIWIGPRSNINKRDLEELIEFNLPGAISRNEILIKMSSLAVDKKEK